MLPNVVAEAPSLRNNLPGVLVLPNAVIKPIDSAFSVPRLEKESALVRLNGAINELDAPSTV